MTEAASFPLNIWERTEEFRKFLEESRQEMGDLVQKLKIRHGFSPYYIGGIEPHMDEDGEPVFWINDAGSFHTGRFYGRKRNWSAEEALQNALKHGAAGWWTLDDLEKLLEVKGGIVEKAMRDGGFRPHKRYADKWSRINLKDENEESVKRIKKYTQGHNDKWPALEREEMKRLDQLRAIPKEFLGASNDYFGAVVNKKGMIYVYSLANAFAGSTDQLRIRMAMMQQRGHITRGQEGFNIDAKNVRLGQEETAIYIKAVRLNGSYAECVWPSKMRAENVLHLAQDLVSRVRGSPVSK